MRTRCLAGASYTRQGSWRAAQLRKRVSCCQVVVTAPAAEPTPTGIITLEIGRVRLRIEGQANAGTLAQVLERVLR